MANIYLRVPTSLAQFYRGRVAPEPPLSEFTPVEFSPFQREYSMMAGSLTMVSEQDCEHSMCFSERMWKNILNGQPPQGGKAIIKRDKTEWPSIDEINTATGAKRNRKSDGFDYLCIATPKQVVIGPQYHSVTSSYTLPFQASNELVRQLRKSFLHVLLYWVTEELFVCNKRGIQRDVIMCIDHFFYHYQMCLGTNKTDRDSMRRMAMRWLEEAKMLPLDIVEEDAFFLTDDEEAGSGIDIDTLLMNVKSYDNKH